MHLTDLELAAELTNRPGLIPTAMDAAGRCVVWVDWEGYHCYEGFFHNSLAMYERLRGSGPATFRSPIESLVSPRVVTADIRRGCLEPAGFIFHAGRSGSTVLAKSLARSRQHLVYGEAAPHNQIWQVLPEHAEAAVDLYRNLLTLMGRRRLPSYAAHIVKFTSFNVVQYHFIRKAFPRVPALFLFRDPASIVESCRRKPPGWLGKDLATGRVWDTVETAVEDYFRGALAIRDPGFHCLDYQHLSARALPAILRLFHLDPPPSELRLMEAEFVWDAKSLAPRPFAAEPRALSAPIPALLCDLYAQLREHAVLGTR